MNSFNSRSINPLHLDIPDLESAYASHSRKYARHPNNSIHSKQPSPSPPFSMHSKPADKERQPLLKSTGRRTSLYGCVDSHNTHRTQSMRNEPPLRKSKSMVDFQMTKSGDFARSREYCNSFLGKEASGPKRAYLKNVKTCLVFILVVVISVFIAGSPERTSEYHEYSVSNELGCFINVSGPSYASLLKLRLRGALLYMPYGEYANISIHVIIDDGEVNLTSLKWTVPVQHTNVELVKEVVRPFLVPLNRSFDSDEDIKVLIFMTTESELALPIGIDYDFLTHTYYYEVAYAGAILLMVYGLIIFELVHRALAAILGSLCTLAIMSVINVRPNLEEIIAWLDFETLSLLFGMMLLVSIFSETGFFDWIALQAYRIARGRPWPLMTILCVVAGLLSAFLDNVTTVLLLTPVTIRLCEALRLDPRKFMIAEVLFANIGGTATAVGDPPNVIIVSSKELHAQGISFLNFTMHMSVGILFISVGAFGLLRILYRNMGYDDTEENYQIVQIRREIEVWKRTAYAISIASKEEATIRALLLAKIADLEYTLSLRRSQQDKKVDFQETLAEMSEKYRITNKWLLIKCSVVMLAVIIAFFISSVVDWFYLNLGWIAFLGAVWLLVLADFAELEALLDRVEWATLIFFAALFALMEALQDLGLISWIGSQVFQLVSSLNSDIRLPVALLAVLWTSAIASSFIDNIPFTAAMIPVVLQLGETLPIMPLVWALAMGACLGGNGTLIGASANVVAAGIAQQHGYGFTFLDFFKVGFLMMIWTTFLASIYLLVCHVAFEWNYS